MNKGESTGKSVTWWSPTEELLSHLLQKGSVAFPSPTGFWLLKIYLAYLQNRNSIVSILLNKKGHYCSLLFARLLCFGMYFIVGQRRHLNKEDAMLWFCLMKWYLQFSMWHWLNPNLCDADVLSWWHTMQSAKFCVLGGPVLIHVSSLFAAPDGPPQDVQLEPISSQSIRVTWKVNTHSQEYRLWQYFGASEEVSLMAVL